MYYGYDPDNRDDLPENTTSESTGEESGSYRYTGDQLWNAREEHRPKDTGSWNGSAYSPTNGPFDVEAEEGRKARQSSAKRSERPRRPNPGSVGPPPRPKPKRWPRTVCLLLLCAFIGGGAGAVIAQSILGKWEQSMAETMAALESALTPTPAEEDGQAVQSPEPSPSDSGASPVASGNGGTMTGQEIYAMATPQVVGITTEIKTTNVFGQTSSSTVTGTGFIISTDGYILTNYHVIEGGAQITVMLADGSYYEAQFIGGESDTSDMAVLKIDAYGLTPVTLGDSASLEVGETIYAVGNPLGELTNSITSGIVSALGREIAIDESKTLNMFQIDAAVNSGNSGGPVYNARGDVVGIVTAKNKATGVEGIGFAIPINDAMNFADQLIALGYIEKPSLGLYYVTVTESYAHYYRTVVGAFVNTVYEQSSGEQAGVLRGDIITDLGGYEIRTAEALDRALYQFEPGDTVMLTVYRGGEYLEMEITLGNGAR